MGTMDRTDPRDCEAQCETITPVGGGAGSGHPSYQRQPEVVELLRPHSHLRLFITSLKHRNCIKIYMQ